MKNIIKLLTYVLMILIVLLYWEYASNNNKTTQLLISSPSLAYGYFLENYTLLFEATAITFYEAFVGLIIATSFSFATIILCLYFPKLMDFILPIMITSQVIPLITLAPLFIMVFGFGVESKIMMAALISFFPIFISFVSGIKLIPKNIHEFMSIHNSNKTQKIFLVFFPLSLPSIMSGLKVAATISVIGAIIAEFSGTQIGIGKNLFLAAKRLEAELMVCSLFFSTLMGAIMYLIIYAIERFTGSWYLIK